MIVKSRSGILNACLLSLVVMLVSCGGSSGSSSKDEPAKTNTPAQSAGDLVGFWQHIDATTNEVRSARYSPEGAYAIALAKLITENSAKMQIESGTYTASGGKINQKPLKDSCNDLNPSTVGYSIKDDVLTINFSPKPWVLKKDKTRSEAPDEDDSDSAEDFDDNDDDSSTDVKLEETCFDKS